MSKTLHGVVHGRTIELSADPGIADGAEVEVVVCQARTSGQPGEGVRRSAGALADSWTEQDNRILEEISEDRRRSSTREFPH